jgi:hypothetical protein
MAEDFRVQWSVSLPPAAQYAKGDMLNVRGESVEEVEALFDAILEDGFIGKASSVADLLRKAQVVTEAPARSAAPADEVGAKRAEKEDGAPPASSTDRFCEHGKMEYKAPFTSRGGKAVSASHNCPLGYKNPAACKTQWAD